MSDTERLEAAAAKLDERALMVRHLPKSHDVTSAEGLAAYEREAVEYEAVGALLRSEATVRATFAAFVELVVALSVERDDGLIDTMSLKRDSDGNLVFDADTSAHALAVADAVLGVSPKNKGDGPFDSAVRESDGVPASPKEQTPREA